MKIMANIRSRRGQRGQALAEMGLVVLLFTVLTLGIIDFGRMLMVMNVVTHAARDGARDAALTAPGNWAGDLAGLQANVEAQVATVTGTGYDVTRSCNMVNGRPRVSVRVHAQGGGEPFIFSFPGLWGGSVDIDRTATFRYEPLETACPS